MPTTDDVTDAYCRRQVSGRRLVLTDDAGLLVPPDCWAGADFSDMDLSRADLSGANLCGANIGGTDLKGANLRGTDLRGADLWGADLVGANLWYADLWEWERGPGGYARRKKDRTYCPRHGIGACPDDCPVPMVLPGVRREQAPAGCPDDCGCVTCPECHQDVPHQRANAGGTGGCEPGEACRRDGKTLHRQKSAGRHGYAGTERCGVIGRTGRVCACPAPAKRRTRKDDERRWAEWELRESIGPMSKKPKKRVESR